MYNSSADAKRAFNVNVVSGDAARIARWERVSSVKGQLLEIYGIITPDADAEAVKLAGR